MQPFVFDPFAIHPLALLAPTLFLWLVRPDPPPIDVIAGQVRELAGRLSKEERERAVAGARMWGAYAAALEKGLG